MNTPQIVLITGGSCSGKTEFSKWFTHSLRLSLDDFYVAKEKLTKDEQGNFQFDIPAAIDIAECAEAVKSLKETGSATIPLYDMKLNDRTGTTQISTEDDTKFIVIEGIFAFHSPLVELGDLKIFVDTPTETRLARRMLRDVERKGKSSIEIMHDFIAAEQSYVKYIEPMKKLADLVVPYSYSPLKFV